MTCVFGDALLIANPASQNGKGKRLTDKATALLKKEFPECSIDVLFTSNPKHATDIAAASEKYDTVIILGGDGAVHEVVNGIMKIQKEKRPRLGILPAGSGNDFAKSIGMPNTVDDAIKALKTACPRLTDVGKVNETYFAETLSFGLDAAIAADSVERRKRTGKKGLRLYGESAAAQIISNFKNYTYTLSIDDGEPIGGSSVTFAVQNGPYYGSGFMICPDAKLTDGFLDVCISHPPFNRVQAMLAFMQAKNGKHTSHKQIETFRAQKLSVSFSTDVPSQTDGEVFSGKEFMISVDHAALNVLYPQ